MAEWIDGVLGGGAVVAGIKLLEVVVNRVFDRADTSQVSDLDRRQAQESREDELVDRYQILLQESARELQTELEEWQRRYQEQTDAQIRKLSEQAASADSRAEKYQTMYIDLMTSYTRATVKITQLQEEMLDLQSRISVMETEHQHTIDAMRERIGLLETEKAELEADLRRFTNGGHRE